MKETIKRSLVWGLIFSLTSLTVFIVYAAIGSTWTNPSTLEVWAWSGLSATSWNKLLENFNNLDGRVNNISVPQFLWQAQQNAWVTVTNQVWTDIPWTSLNINLATSKKIWMRAFWSIIPTNTWNTSWSYSTHCWFRYVIDWIPYWNSSWWDQIIWCWYNMSNYWARCNWNLEKVLDLAAWSHAIKVQMKDRQVWYFWCVSEDADHSRARLFVETKN